MDIAKLAGTLLSSDALSGLSERSGASKSDVKKVISQVLPTLLGGADSQAKGDTAEGFAAALSSHAKDDTSNLLDFLGNVDLTDGSKIIGHLLGADTESTTKTVAKKTGVSQKKTQDIMSAAAPLLMSLLGQQADEDDDKDSGVANLMGALLSNVDVGAILTGLLTDDDDSTSKKSSSKKTTSKKKSAKKSSSSDLGDVVGSLLGKLLK